MGKNGNNLNHMTIKSTVCSTIIFCLFLWPGLSMVVEARYVLPEDCTWEPVLDSVTVSMTCSLPLLYGGPSPTNFSLIMPGHTVRLSIHCTAESYTSTLAGRSFEHLNDLQSLTIYGCHLDQLGPETFHGLMELRNLTVKTFNNEEHLPPLWVSATTFVPLRRSLISLDLSENNIDSFPHGLLCGLDQLRFVNLTRNKFSDVLSIGLSSLTSCDRVLVSTLEVAHNELKALPERGFALLAQLEELSLNNNELARAEPSALSGLSQLRRLDMTHNKLVALPATLFQSTPKLAELYLRNNSLSALSPDLLKGLVELTVLDLAHNQLSSLGWLGLSDQGTTSNMTQLSDLDLSHNQLTRLEAGVFHSLQGLQTLRLQDNLIEFIADNTFRGVSNLQSLILSNNRLQRIEPRMMIGLTSSLVTLQLDKNRLEDIHPDVFRDMTVLQELNLAENRLSVVPRAVSVLSMLRSLNLSGNGIENINNASYQGLTRLFALDLVGNKVGNISKGAFNDLPSVRILYLAQNHIQAIEKGTFDDLPGLHFLRLDSNIIDDVSGLFTNLHDLIMLNISVNRVRWFDYAMIPLGLQWLDIHDNQVEVLGNYYELEQNLKLRTIDASFNKLTDLDSSSLPNSIENVFLRHNLLRRIQPFTFLGKQNLARVDLTYNQIQVLNMTTFRLSEVSSRRPLPEFKIANNPCLCDCHMQWLQQLQDIPTQGPVTPSGVNENRTRQYPRIVDLANVTCTLSFSRGVRVMPLVRVKPNDFLCEVKGSCCKSAVCSDNCTCFHDSSWITSIVDCSSRSQTDTPKDLPMNVTKLYMDGNNIATLHPHSFVGHKSLQVIFLNNSNVLTIRNRTFASLQQLRVLHLEGNQLSTFTGHEFDGLPMLTELYLSNNRISFISNTTFEQLGSLEILHLNRNRLVEMSLWSFRLNPRLIEIRISGNQWACVCRFTEDLAQFLQLRRHTVGDLLQLTCVYNATRILPLWNQNGTECHNKRLLSVAQVPQYQLRRIEEFLPMFLFIGGVFFALLVIIIVLIACRRQIRVWIFSRYGVRFFHRQPAEEEKLFDAFISYSKKDEAFVAQILAPELECGTPPYRLCLHYRDLPMIGAYLSEAIQEAVESSRRTIVVLSEHFLKSGWCRYEFKSAHHEVLTNSHHKLVVIFVGRVSYSELDPDMRGWLKHSTFLHWGEKNFWKKLRYSMPDARHRNKAMRSDLNSVAVHI